MEGESISWLLCQENEQTTSEEQAVDEDIFIPQSHRDLDKEEEYVKMLVDKEISFGFKKDPSLVLDNWVKCARLEAISWVLKTCSIFGFRFQTAYLSMTYFDRFLSKKSIDTDKWALKLLSVACLSLAAKMEEVKAPALSQFQIEEYNFESKVIRRMELLVLNTLQWRMISATPFSFIQFFVIKFCKESPPRHIVSRTVGFIFAVMRDINLMDYRPSVIAAASTLVALNQSLTRKALEHNINSVSNSRFLEIEDVFQCYNAMQNLKSENVLTSKVSNSSHCLRTHWRPNGVLENSLVTSTKRKNLAFDASDSNLRLPEEKRSR